MVIITLEEISSNLVQAFSLCFGKKDEGFKITRDDIDSAINQNQFTNFGQEFRLPRFKSIPYFIDYLFEVFKSRSTIEKKKTKIFSEVRAMGNMEDVCNGGDS